MFGLNTSSKYYASFKAVNEAGESAWSSYTALVDTSQPWAPEAVKSIAVNCSENCHIEWAPAGDNGRPITYYQVVLSRKFDNDSEVGKGG